MRRTLPAALALVGLLALPTRAQEDPGERRLPFLPFARAAKGDWASYVIAQSWLEKKAGSKDGPLVCEEHQYAVTWTVKEVTSSTIVLEESFRFAENKRQARRKTYSR